MPLTASLADGATLDATDCDEVEWAAVHRVRPRPSLTCRYCGEAMHAKVSSAGLRFFAHDRRVPSCPSDGETPEHRWLKRRLADAVRAARWLATVEAQPSVGDRGGWRADVLAVSADGRRVAFEAQLAAMTAAEGAERVAGYGTDGIPSVWVTTKGASWLYRIPGVQVTEDPQVPEADGRGPLMTRRGCAQLRDGTAEEGWMAREGVPLPRLVAGILTGRVIVHTLHSLYETVQAGSQERSYWHRDAAVLVPAKHVVTARDHEAKRRVEKARADEQQERWQKNIEALELRQQELLPIAVAAAASAARPGDTVWVGVPPTSLGLSLVGQAWTHLTTGEIVGSGDVLAGLIPVSRVTGREATGHGLAIWLGPHRANLQLFALVCPVANWITPRLAASWRRRRVRVYVREEREAHRVADSLGWPITELHLVAQPINEQLDETTARVVGE